mmetsp:Transcript_20282/g.26171  ORF Transcript_20282/g.26171 Transcript_20282/m.26171 type:complete len:88 (-) Transcript_20282:193-456(-)
MVPSPRLLEEVLDKVAFANSCSNVPTSARSNTAGTTLMKLSSSRNTTSVCWAWVNFSGDPMATSIDPGATLQEYAKDHEHVRLVVAP